MNPLPLEQVEGSQYMIGQEAQEEDDQGNDDGGQCLPVRKAAALILGTSAFSRARMISK